jgi:hypothetical protein
MKLDALKLRLSMLPARIAALRAPWAGVAHYRPGRADLAAARGLILGLALAAVLWALVAAAVTLWAG